MASGATTRWGTAALALAALLGGCGEDAPRRDATGAIERAGETRLLKLRAGDCVRDLRESLENPDGGFNGVPKVTAVGCSDEHDGELVSVAPLGGGAWPGFAAVDGAVSRGRRRLQARLVRAARTGGPITLVSFRPTKERWDFEDQHAVYFLALYDRRQRVQAPK
jgi:hypothetical protein